MAGKLHELLAVEGDLDGTFKKILQETMVNFTKHAERYFGQKQSVEYFDEEMQMRAEAPVYKQLDDTVPDKLKYTQDHIIRFFDAVLQKEATNQVASADLVVDGITIAKDVPATFLLGLESKLKTIRNSIYENIPTLQPGIKWELDESIGPNVYHRAHPEEREKGKKVLRAFTKAEATEHHPAQVETFTETEKVGKTIIDTWCGMIPSAKKSELLGRIDKLIREVKKARQRANRADVIDRTIGKEIFDYING